MWRGSMQQRSSSLMSPHYQIADVLHAIHYQSCAVEVLKSHSLACANSLPRSVLSSCRTPMIYGKGPQIAVTAWLEALHAAHLVSSGTGPRAWTHPPTGIIFARFFSALELAMAELERVFKVMLLSLSTLLSISHAATMRRTQRYPKPRHVIVYSWFKWYWPMRSFPKSLGLRGPMCRRRWRVLTWHRPWGKPLSMCHMVASRNAARPFAMCWKWPLWTCHAWTSRQPYLIRAGMPFICPCEFCVIIRIHNM